MLGFRPLIVSIAVKKHFMVMLYLYTVTQMFGNPEISWQGSFFGGYIITNFNGFRKCIR